MLSFREEIRQQILDVKKQHKEDLKRKQLLTDGEQAIKKAKSHTSDLMKEYAGEKDKYSHLKKDMNKKGSSREDFTLNLLAKFKTKLFDAKEKVTSGETSKPLTEDPDVTDVNWLGHELHFEDNNPVLAKDAATKEDDWYDVYDPRNPINKRRREASKKNSSHRK